jgi:hypothetical protein
VFDLEANMATLFEQSINHNTRCFACGSLVYAVEKKMTTHHVNILLSRIKFRIISSRFIIIDVFVVVFANEI